MSTMEDLLGKQLGPIHTTIEKLPERFREQAQISQYERLRGKKFVRIPVISGVVASNAVNFGGDTGLIRCGPDQGYTWSLGLLAIEGLATGASQDTVQIFRNSNTGQSRLIWQLTGNQPVSTFGKGQQILKGGEALLVVNLGSISAAAGSEITLSGMAREVPAEREGELF